MHPKNIYATRTALTEWAGQSYVNKADGVSLDPRLESFGSNTRLAIEVQRFGSYLTTIYAYGTAAIRDADTGRDVNVGSIVYSETNGPLAFWSGSAWAADGFALWTAMRSALAAFAASLVIVDGVPIPGPPGTTDFEDLDGLPTTLEGYGVDLPAEPFTPPGGGETTVGAVLEEALTAIQPDTLPTTPYRVYPTTGLLRSAADRARDYIVVSDFSDGTGNPSNDDAAFQAALTLAGSSDANQKVVLVTRPFQLLTEKTLPHNCNIWGAHGDGRIFANAGMRSIFNVDKDAVSGGGVGVCVKDLTIGNRDNLYTNAAALFRVRKGWDNQAIKLLNITAFAAEKVVDWIDGDYPVFDNICTYSCVDTLYFRNNGMNGSIKGLKTLGGRSFFIDKADVGGQQMEGTQFYNVQGLASGPINGKTPFAAEIRAGLKLGFHGLLLDQVAGAAALMIDGTGKPVSGVEIYNLWIGSAANQESSSYGLFGKGNVSELKVFGGEVVDIRGVGIQLDGMGSTINAHFVGVRCRLNSSLDMYADDARVKIDGCTFDSANTIQGSETSYVTGEDNSFASGTPILNGKFNLLRSAGPAAPALGIPTSPSGYPPSWFYSDGGTVKVT